MPKEKFNPIANLPELPGAEIVNGDDNPTLTSKYPPTEVPEKENAKQPQIEIRLKPAMSENEVKEKIEEKESNRLTLIRSTILVSLIVLVIIGIFLTVQVVPRIISNIPTFSQSFSYLFVSKNTATSTANKNSNQVPAYVPLVVTSTPTNSTPTNPIVNPVFSNPITKVAQKTPAKLIANLISTNTFGYQTVVKFNIKNIGGSTSGTWSFSATLPSNINPVYYSTVQNPLTSQSGVINTLTFTQDQYINSPVLISIYQ